MTSPLHDAAIEAGARFLCAEMSDDFREGAAYWKHVAQGFITALAAKGLVVVPREPTQAMLDAVVTYPAGLVAERNDPEYTAQMQAATATERALAAQRYRAMIAAAREDRAQPDLRLYGRPEQSAELPVTTRLGALL